ncbi:hypothetical protein PVAP13_5KG169435 [Panicum virgatum]|uniref:Uncharacterized protein n=1 Tax=Panicum virgatum TaxID=38727 RepID=A0A8T0SEF9_PANVG|nr:hypothetical protein PVAP13_5KG169435 [Panicum virgatum]
MAHKAAGQAHSHWARGPAAADGSVARHGLVSTPSGGRSSFVVARRPRPQAETETHSHAHPGFIPAHPHSLSLPSPLRPLSLSLSLSLSLPSVDSPLPRPAISPPVKPPTTLAEPAPTPRARGAGERPPRRASAAAERCQIRGPAPFGRGFFSGDGAVAGCRSGGSGPGVRVTRGNSRELRGAPAALGGGWNGEFWCPVPPRPRAGSSG